MKNSNNSFNSFGEEQSKDTINKNLNKGQIVRTYESFLEYPKTMKEVSVETGIMRCNICRYISRMLEHNRIVLLRKRFCTVTNSIAGEYTTDPNLFPKSDNNL